MLIEVVLAVGILSLVLIGVSDLMTRTQRASTFHAKQDKANSIAKEIINEYRLQRDEDPEGFAGSVVGLNNSECESNSDFGCVVSVTVLDDETVELNIVVSWQEGDNTFKVVSDQKLSKL